MIRDEVVIGDFFSDLAKLGLKGDYRDDYSSSSDAEDILLNKPDSYP